MSVPNMVQQICSPLEGQVPTVEEDEKAVIKDMYSGVMAFSCPTFCQLTFPMYSVNTFIYFVYLTFCF